MDKATTKQAVLAAAKRKLEEHMAEYKERINELRAETVENDLPESASQTEGRRDANIELMNSIGEQYEEVQRELDTLAQVDGEPCADVRFGAVVHTNLRNLLIATSVDEFKAAGRSYLGLSAQAPLFLTMKGKKVGDILSYNDMTYTIEDIF